MAGYFGTKKSQLRPRTLQMVIQYFIFMSMSTSLVAGNVIVSLYFKHYSNPNHKDITGNCCDWFCHVGFIRSCENQITLCIDDIESASDQCPFFDGVIYYENRDDFDFPPVLLYSIPNPIPINITDYKGGIRIKMTIVDDDRLSNDDIIDHYNQDISITPSTSVHSARTRLYNLSGQGYSQTTIEVKVYCDVNFYGTNCSVKCVAFDNDDNGHYTCDPSTGDKVCLPGYDGTLCKTALQVTDVKSVHVRCKGSVLLTSLFIAAVVLILFC